MDSLFTLTTGFRVNLFNLPTTYQRRSNFFSLRPKSFVVSASKDEPKFDDLDLMELKFGRMLGEDPKLTLAKIAGRKANSDVSYLEIEKAFRKNKFQYDDEVVEEFKKKTPNSVNLVRPVPKKGVKFEEDYIADKPYEFQQRPPSTPLNLVRPVPKDGIKFEEDDNVNKPFEFQKNKARSSSIENLEDSPTKGSSIPNVILRKPSAAYPEDDIEVKKPLRLTIQPNLSLKMGKGESAENFSDITLLKKPEPARLVIDTSLDNTISGDSTGSTSALNTEASKDSYEPLNTSNDSFPQVAKIEDKAIVGLQPLEQNDLELDGTEASTNQPEVELQGKPSRLDQSAKGEFKPVEEEADCASNGHAQIESFVSAPPLQECEEADWSRAEYLCNTGGREEVELISCSTRGFVASFGSLIGFLPYRNLGARWKFLAFESWLRKKGLEPSMYRQSLGIVGGYESPDKNFPKDTNQAPEIVDGKLSPNMKLEDLLEIYNQEKIKFLSSFIGLRIKVNLVLADRNSRKLMFSGKPKEKEELVLKKRSLMAKLSIGDVVRCSIKKITYFGIFVEVEGVPALIHQSEVSWDATLDPSAFFKIGQIVEAKVHQVDFTLGRIFLSLKEITPDPLIEALESVVGDHNSLEGDLEAAQADIEWADVESLIKELEDIEGVQSVSKGRFFMSPGLAPTFQVYMASMFQNQYKLLARSGNKVQEVIVKATLDKEEMKAAILACTNRPVFVKKMSSGSGTSNFVIRWINFLTMLLALVVIGFGLWMGIHHDGCRKSLTLPVIGLGAFILLVSLIGFLGAYKNISILLWIYLVMLCLILVAILVFTVLA
ncbi:30S ribosomal protein S1 [Thalictrum thalictroides]|uniref:30S ribosomal protein S1 n=1 Tax=Thalictrum thalictroides TaxID=46969 RepID=A0A7J6WBL8_THATH|nr:30S ribosomal protein S1 [Thalictrum thalictroides]